MMFRFIFLLGCLGVWGGLSARAQSEALTPDQRRLAYIKATQSVDKDLEAALGELARQREQISKEKPPLSKEANEVAADLRENRRKADLARISRDAAESEFAKTERDLRVWRDEKQYVESLMLEFRKAFEAQQTLARANESRDLLNDHTLEGRLALLEKTLEQIETVSSVSVLPGEALSESGEMVSGVFAEAGPVSWFVSEDKKVSGLVTVAGDLSPKVVPGTAQADAVQRVVAGGEAHLSFDPSLGNAIKFNESSLSWWEHVQQGGFWVYVILFLGVVAILTTIYKWLQLSRIRHFPAIRVQNIVDALNRGDEQKAREVAARIKHPARNILEHGIDVVSSNSNYNKEDLEEGLYERYIAVVPKLQRGLLFIAIASAASPLLGLLGTVTGIMKIFKLINVFGTGDARTLASGISEALTATEYGLVVAIPALIMHALLARSVNRIKDTMELTSLAFMNGLEGGHGPRTHKPGKEVREARGGEGLAPSGSAPEPA